MLPQEENELLCHWTRDTEGRFVSALLGFPSRSLASCQTRIVRQCVLEFFLRT